HTGRTTRDCGTAQKKLPPPNPPPINIRVWYPEQKSDAKPMEYRRYLDVSSNDERIAPFEKRLSRQVVNVVSETTVGKEPPYRTPAETGAFERLLATRTIAVKDAPPAEGRFPLVIYHPRLTQQPGGNSALSAR